MRKHIQRKIEEVRNCLNHSFREQAHKVLVMLLGQQRCTRDPLAAYLALHHRTLNRRLKEAGTSFRELQAAACYEMVRQLLRDTKRSLTAIAAMLGYSDATAFSRSFTKREGASPAGWRKLAGVVSEPKIMNAVLFFP